jgi:glucose/arabinose dehydrogenase
MINFRNLAAPLCLLVTAWIAAAAASGPTGNQPFRVETFATGLVNPWAIAFLPDGTALITERPGRLRVVTPDGNLLPDPVSNTPEVWARGQGGLLDVQPHPNYSGNGWIYLSYSRSFGRNSTTEIVRGRIRDHAWVDQEIIFEADAASANSSHVHFGNRMRFCRDGFLWFTIGDRGTQNEAQNLSSHRGKLFRVHDDGRIPSDNPFVDRAGAIPSIWSYGHRNPQGLAWDLEGNRLWSTEHGPRGGDELNLIRRGANYGWPVITYGINYNGTIISELTHKDGMEQPEYQWTPSIGASGLEFYTGEAFPQWQGSLLAGGLAISSLWRFSTDGDRITGHEVVLRDVGRVRDVRQGPRGHVYVVLDQPGSVIRLVP